MHSVQLVHLLAGLLLCTLGSAAVVPYTHGLVAEKPASRGGFGSSPVHSAASLSNSKGFFPSSAIHSIGSPVHSAGSQGNANRFFGQFPTHGIASPGNANGLHPAAFPGHFNSFHAGSQDSATKRANFFRSPPYVFKHKVVYVNAQRCELVCRSRVCQYCPRNAQHKKFAPVSGNCFSPRRSTAIDIEYSSKHTPAYWTRANDAGFAPSSHVFIHKVVFVASRRCELVCENAVCRYCPRDMQPLRSGSRSGKPYGQCYSPTRSASIDREYSGIRATSDNATGALCDPHSGRGCDGEGIEDGVQGYGDGIEGHGLGFGPNGEGVGVHGRGLGFGANGNGIEAFENAAGAPERGGSFGKPVDLQGHDLGIKGNGIDSHAVGVGRGSFDIDDDQYGGIGESHGLAHDGDDRR